MKRSVRPLVCELTMAFVAIDGRCLNAHHLFPSRCTIAMSHLARMPQTHALVVMGVWRRGNHAPLPT
jgi:hypothetical protein